ncbi:MAG: hypothetical protein HQL82_08640 [Magnetococcales bacterium]|nr:hypothetical protein [Magnetococcales bacterium]
MIVWIFQYLLDDVGVLENHPSTIQVAVVVQKKILVAGDQHIEAMVAGFGIDAQKPTFRHADTAIPFRLGRGGENIEQDDDVAE